MVTQARGGGSQSLLRESETAEFFLDKEVEDFFNRAVDKVVEKRLDPEVTKTGAKELRENLLSYLEQQGEVKTANIWARALDVSRIAELKQRLRLELEELDIKGVVEIHLADREINSPHLQYTGTDAELVEDILANLLVKMKLEYSYEDAVSRDKKPDYLSTTNLSVLSTDKQVRIYEKNQAEQQELEQQEAEKTVENIADKIDKTIDKIKNFKNELFSKFKRATTKEDNKEEEERPYTHYDKNAIKKRLKDEQKDKNIENTLSDYRSRIKKEINKIKRTRI